MHQKKTKPEATTNRAQAPKQTKPQRQSSDKSTSTEAQIARLLHFIRRRSRSTYDLRSQGISHPAARVKDLMRRGYVIASDRITSVDSDGFTHQRVALYSLVAEPEGTA